jgi:hypothetical protein
MTATRYLRRCAICGNELSTEEPSVHQWTAGWVKRRDGGGGHGVSCPERSDKWAHGYCVDQKTRGHIGQGSLAL